MTAAWIDISVPLETGMEHWPGDPEVSIAPYLELERDGCNARMLHMSTHTGTHIDAPLHFLKAGGTIDEMPLTNTVGEARVITPADIDSIGRGERILLKCGGVAIDEATADVFARRSLACIGIDGLSIGSDAVHRVLLEANVYIVEGLDLHAVEPGTYDLVCLPLRIRGGDGAPARAFVRRRT